LNRGGRLLKVVVDGGAVAVVVVVVVVLVVVPVVVSLVEDSPDGLMSVVDSSTLVVKDVGGVGELLGGTMGSGAAVVASGGSTVVAGNGVLHWSDIETTATTRPITSSSPTPPAAKAAVDVRYHGSSSGAMRGDTSGAAGRMPRP
jgi:hypothetical protein